MAELHQRRDRGNIWELDYVDVDGTRFRLSTGTTDKKIADLWLKKAEDRLSQARLGLIDKVGRIDADVVAGREGKSKAARIALEDLRKEFEERSKFDLMLDENTVRLTNASFRSLVEAVGNKKLSQFSQEDVMKWKRGLDREGRKRTTISIYFRSLRAVFNRAIRWKIIQSNPFFDIDLPAPKRGEAPPKTMKVDEVRKLLEVIEQDGNTKYATYLRFVMYTGCRRSEILHLRWEDVNTEKRLLIVNADKTNKILRLPINKALMRVISGMEQSTGFIFKTDSHSMNRKKQGIPWHESTVTHWFQDYIRKAGLPLHYHIHSLRHTYSNFLREKGVPIDIIQRLLGHSSPKTTWDHYDSSDALFFRSQADLVDFEEGC